MPLDTVLLTSEDIITYHHTLLHNFEWLSYFLTPTPVTSSGTTSAQNKVIECEFLIFEFFLVQPVLMDSVGDIKDLPSLDHN